MVGTSEARGSRMTWCASLGRRGDMVSLRGGMGFGMVSIGMGEQGTGAWLGLVCSGGTRGQVGHKIGQNLLLQIVLLI